MSRFPKIPNSRQRWFGWCLPFLLLLFFSHPLAAAPPISPTPEEIDAFVQERMAALRIPGAAIGIVQNDEIFYMQGYGVADPSGRAVTPHTPFLLASLTKSFTALAIMQLVEAGKLELDAPVQQYLPWFTTANGDLTARITVRHLLTHSGGISEVSGNAFHFDSDTSEQALENAMRTLSNQSLHHPPGTQFEYSNTNYDLLGLLIQELSGEPYEAYIEREIFAPLGMNHSYTSLAAARAGNLAGGYRFFFGQQLTYDAWLPYSRTSVPAAGLFSSTEDMAHYLMVHLNGGRYGDSAILSPQGIATLHTPAVPVKEGWYYAFGWNVIPFRPDLPPQARPTATALRHNGTWAGYRSTMVLLPDQNLGIVVLMNTNDELRESVFDTIGMDLASMMVGLDAQREPPSEDFMTQNALYLLSLAIILLGVGNWGWVRATKRLGDKALPLRTVWIYALMPTLLEWALAYYLFGILIPGLNSTLPLIIRFMPDLGILYSVIVLLTLGVGTIRTMLWLGAKYRKQKAETT